MPARTNATEHAAVLTRAELQRLRSLREKKTRESLGLFVVEGEKVVGELLAADFPFEAIYTTRRNASAVGLPRVGTPSPSSRGPHDGPAASTRPTYAVTAAEMARISHFPTPSTILAVGRIHRPPLAPADLAAGLTLALDGVQDAGNVGTLLRIADWFAFDRVLLSSDCADLFHQKTINASMGSFARVRTHTADLAAAFAALREHAPAERVPILGCDLAGDNAHAVPPLRDAIVVVGSEGRGLSPAVAACLTRRIAIPRYGAAESLNAAIAAAIVCDNLRRAQSANPPIPGNANPR